MSRTSATLEGWDLIARRIAPDRLRDASRVLLTRVGVIVERNTRTVTPVLTGALRRSITNQVQGVDRVVIGTNLNYAPIVHKLKPFLTRGLEASEGEIRQAMQTVGDRFLRGDS